jgi:pimeloyl-ACP methyl ester carboxylesterase
VLHRTARGEGRTLLLVHGFAVDHRILTPLDGAAARAGWRRLYADLPGMGRSAGVPAASTDDVLDALEQVVDAEIGTEPFAVLAARRPGQVAGVGLLCPVVGEVRDLPPRHVARADPALLAALDPEDAEAFAEVAVVQSPATWALFRDHVLPGLRAADQAALARIRARYAPSRTPEADAPFAGPTLLVAGRHDHVVGYRDALRLLADHPRATVAVLDDAGHNAHLERPDVAGALVTEWLGRVGAAVSG